LFAFERCGHCLSEAKLQAQIGELQVLSLIHPDAQARRDLNLRVPRVAAHLSSTFDALMTTTRSSRNRATGVTAAYCPQCLAMLVGAVIS